MTRTELLKNPLFRLLFFNGLAGVLAAGVVPAGLAMTDVGGLGHLVMTSDNPVLPVALLFAELTITLASVAMGAAVMSLPNDSDETGSGRRLRIDGASPEQPPRMSARAVVRPKS